MNAVRGVEAINQRSRTQRRFEAQEVPAELAGCLLRRATFLRRDEQLSLVRGLRLPPRLMFHHRVDDGEELAHHRDEGHLCWLASDPETSIEVA